MRPIRVVSSYGLHPVVRAMKNSTHESVKPRRCPPWQTPRCSGPQHRNAASGVANMEHQSTATLRQRGNSAGWCSMRRSAESMRSERLVRMLPVVEARFYTLSCECPLFICVLATVSRTISRHCRTALPCFAAVYTGRACTLRVVFGVFLSYNKSVAVDVVHPKAQHTLFEKVM